MKKNLHFLLIITLFVSLSAVAQQKKANLSFTEVVHNFGQINEEDGPVKHTFEFTNTGGETLIITRVKASCGCTTPTWTKEPVPPGEKGFVSAAYNPKNRPGKFNKSITVTSNAENSTVVLRIQGKVIQKEQPIEKQYPEVMNDLRMKSKHLTVGKILNDQKKSKSLEVYNTSKEDMTIAFFNVPKHLSMKAVPATIKSGEKGSIVATYDASRKNDWDFVIDRVVLVINGNKDYNNSISVSASITENFSNLTSEQRANAPTIEVEEPVFDFGRIKEGEKATTSFVIKNTGKSDLIIRKTKATCGCTATKLANETVAPGKSTTIEATFNSKGRVGSQNKRITVISNDPKKPKTLLSIKGTVEKAE